tara:strand:- start:41 stop:265 length:225 start_codon:yes stop_codon:yes gene_type:complete
MTQKKELERGDIIDFNKARQILQQALPYNVYHNIEVKDVIPCANSIIMFSSSMAQRMQINDFDMKVSVKWKCNE